MEPELVVIYGAGGFARELAWLIETCNKEMPIYRIACFIDDDPSEHGKIVNDIPVLGLHTAREKFPTASIVGGIGSPSAREILMNKASQAGFSFSTIIHPDTERSEWIEIGVGTVICAGNILTTNIQIGNHVQINLDCTVGHDVIMGDYTTTAPGVHISGRVHLGKRVYIGTGAVIINGTDDNPIVIEDDVTIGAGACVTKSVSKGLTVVGVPAKPLEKRS